MSEKSSSHETAEHKDATKASDAYLAKKGGKFSRWFGHGVRWVGTELAITWGTGLATFGTLGAILTGGTLSPLILAAVGGGLAATGVAAQWEIGMKHAKNESEKVLFWLSKMGQTIGNPALSVLTGGSYPALATGMAIAGGAMGARAMAHRK